MSAAARATWTAGLGVAGGLVSASLWSTHLAVYEHGVSTGQFCGSSGVFDCDAVAAHPSSVVAGFPLPLLGLLYYAFVVLLAGAAAALRGEDRRAVVALGAVAAVLAVAFDAYLALVSWMEIGAFCSLCLASYGVNVALALVLRSWDRAAPGPIRWRRLLPSARDWRGADGPHHREAFKACYLAVGAAVLFTLHVGAALPFAEARRRGTARVDELLLRILTQPPAIDMQRFADQPAAGPEDARLEIAVAADFQCAYCRSLARSLERWRARFPERLRLVFVNAPLGQTCQPALPADLHPDACWLAEVGEAAAAQGRFWKYHDHLFRLAPEQVTRDRVRGDLAALGLDVARIDRDLASGEPAARVAGDLRLCRECGLTATPSLAIAGQPIRGGLPPWMVDALLSALIDAGG